MTNKKTILMAQDIKGTIQRSDQLMEEVLTLLRSFFRGHETIDMRYKLYRKLDEVKSNHRLIENSLKQLHTTLKKKSKH